MENSSKNNLFIYIVLFAIFGSLVFAGIRLIVQSEAIYTQSYSLTEKVLVANANKLNSGQAPNYSGVKDGYSQALSFFMLALGCVVVMLLLPRLQTFSISPSGINVTLQNLEQNVSNLMQQTNTLQAKSAGTGGIKPADETDQKKAPLLKKPDTNADDPQKNKWGGKSERNDRKMTAEVKATKSPGFYQVSISVESTNTGNPLAGVVNFHLHPTFINPNPVIAVRDGKAVLELKKVYGAFTVGADMDNGKTSLELDLAELEEAPAEFKLR
jgi:hypothetical protein